jgi:hypothetical protein
MQRVIVPSGMAVFDPSVPTYVGGKVTRVIY